MARFAHETPRRAPDRPDRRRDRLRRRRTVETFARHAGALGMTVLARTQITWIRGRLPARSSASCARSSPDALYFAGEPDCRREARPAGGRDPSLRPPARRGDPVRPGDFRSRRAPPPTGGTCRTWRRTPRRARRPGLGRAVPAPLRRGPEQLLPHRVHGRRGRRGRRRHASLRAGRPITRSRLRDAIQADAAAGHAAGTRVVRSRTATWSAPSSRSTRSGAAPSSTWAPSPPRAPRGFPGEPRDRDVGLRPGDASPGIRADIHERRPLRRRAPLGLRGARGRQPPADVPHGRREGPLRLRLEAPALRRVAGVRQQQDAVLGAQRASATNRASWLAPGIARGPPRDGRVRPLRDGRLRAAPGLAGLPLGAGALRRRGRPAGPGPVASSTRTSSRTRDSSRRISTRPG